MTFKKIIFFVALCCGLKLLTIMITLASPSPRAHALHANGWYFCLQNVLSNGDGDGKNDAGQSTNQLFRIM